MKVKYYEIHMTVDADDIDVEDLRIGLKSFKYDERWWWSKVNRDIDHPTKEDLKIMTMRCKSLSRSREWISFFRQVAKECDCDVTRAKIEAVIYDKREKA